MKDGVLGPGHHLGRVLAGETRRPGGRLVAIAPGDLVAVVVEQERGRAAAGQGIGGVLPLAQRLGHDAYLARRRAVTLDADHRRAGIHPDAESGIARDDFHRGLFQQQGGLDVYNVQRGFGAQPETTQFREQVIRVVGIDFGNVQHQVAIGFDPDVQADVTVAERHRIERTLDGRAFPDDVAAIEIADGGRGRVGILGGLFREQTDFPIDIQACGAIGKIETHGNDVLGVERHAQAAGASLAVGFDIGDLDEQVGGVGLGDPYAVGLAGASVAVSGEGLDFADLRAVFARQFHQEGMA